jgi:transcriptional accessory protein Tex/SPT6
VAGAGKLEAEQIANGTIMQIVARVKQGCYAKLTATDKKFVDDVISELEKPPRSPRPPRR